MKQGRQPRVKSAREKSILAEYAISNSSRHALVKSDMHSSHRSLAFKLPAKVRDHLQSRVEKIEYLPNLNSVDPSVGGCYKAYAGNYYGLVPGVYERADIPQDYFDDYNDAFILTGDPQLTFFETFFSSVFGYRFTSFVSAFFNKDASGWITHGGLGSPRKFPGSPF